MQRRAGSTDWAADVDALVQQAPTYGTERDPLNAQVRLLALLSSTAPLNVLLDALATYVETWALGLHCSVMLVDASGRRLRPGAAPSLPAAYVRAIDPVPIRVGQGSCGTAAATGEMVVVEDVEQSTLWASCASTALVHGLRACWSVPILDENRALLGTLAAYYRERRAPTAAEINLIQFAASLAAFVIRRHADADKLRESGAQLEAAVGGTGIGLWNCDSAGEGRWFDDWCERFDIDPCDGPDRDRRWCERVHPDDVDRYKASDSDCGRSAAEHYAVEYRIRTRSGRWRWLHERGRVTARDAQGLPTLYVGVCFDIDEQKRLAAALRTAEDRYELAINAAQLPVWEYDVARDTVRGNVYWHRAIGHDISEEQATERVETWVSDVHPDDVAKHAQVFSEPSADSTGFYQTEFRMKLPNGTYKWLLDRARVVDRAPDGTPVKIVGVSIDIDARKRIEETLRTSEARFETTVGGSDIGLWDWSLGADALTWLSDWPLRKGLKATQDPSTYAEILAAAHVDDRHRLEADAEAVISGRQESIECDYRMRTTLGASRWIQIRARVIDRSTSGRATRIAGTCIDVDERRRAEEQLRTQAMILETMREGVVLVDSTGHIELTNPAITHMFGPLPHSRVGTSIVDLLSDSRVEEPETATIDRLLARCAERAGLCDALFRRVDGTEFAGEVLSGKIEFASGKKWLLVIQDVSERRQLEREILNIATRERRRLGSDLHDGLGQELTGVALMLRSLATQLRRDVTAAAPPIDDIVAVVNHAIQSARAIARGLSPVTLDHDGLVSALHELTSQSRVIYGIDVRLRSKAIPGPNIDETTANHLYRIAQEAINNAVRHGRAQSVSLSLRIDPNTIELSVGDDGTGLTEWPTRTAGMGLKIMAYRARLIGGMMTIGRRRGGGTLIKCSCPPCLPPTTSGSATA